jgi:transcriptional regulator with XRE-family HTH domain
MASSASVFPERLRQIRKERGFTQESLARELEVSWPTVSRWERGMNAPSLDRLVVIAAVLDVAVVDLVAEDAA